jgi:flagellar protein FliT
MTEGKLNRDGGPLAGAELLRQYEAIGRESRQMLEAARAGDWAGVARIEDECRRMIAGLKGGAGLLTPAENLRRVQVLRAILADDAQMRQRAQPWLGNLEQVLDGSFHEPRRGTHG